MSDKIRITWVRSEIGFERDQRRTIRALGLKRLQQTVEHQASPTVLGMVHKVRHMVVVESGDGALVTCSHLHGRKARAYCRCDRRKFWRR